MAGRSCQAAAGTYNPAGGHAAVAPSPSGQCPASPPELQLAHHLGYPLDEDDRHDLALLANRFNLPLPPPPPTSEDGA